LRQRSLQKHQALLHSCKNFRRPKRKHVNVRPGQPPPTRLQFTRKHRRSLRALGSTTARLNATFRFQRFFK
jgi:hypothetical protein